MGGGRVDVVGDVMMIWFGYLLRSEFEHLGRPHWLGGGVRFVSLKMWVS
jgi:hypothetical protein